MEAAECSHALINILICGGVTQPKIAARIAAFTGATPQQWDEIVHEKHRGKYRPPKKKARQEKAKPERKIRKVVALDRIGNEIRRYDSTAEAAQAIGMSTTIIQRRCACNFDEIKDEFASLGFTFRYADAWDVLTDAQKMENIQQCTGK